MDWDYLKFSGQIELLSSKLDADKRPNILSYKKQIIAIIRLIPVQWRYATKALIGSAKNCTLDQFLHVLDYDLQQPGDDPLQLSTFSNLKNIVEKLKVIEARGKIASLEIQSGESTQPA